MRSDAIFDYSPPPRKMTDAERLDFLDQMTSVEDRVLLETRRGGGWELRSTANKLDGRIGVRHAIDEYARARGYRPPPEHRGLATVGGGRRRVQQAFVLGLCLVAAFFLLVLVACPDPYPSDLRESSSRLSCPPHRESLIPYRAHPAGCAQGAPEARQGRIGTGHQARLAGSSLPRRRRGPLGERSRRDAFGRGLARTQDQSSIRASSAP